MWNPKELEEMTDDELAQEFLARSEVYDMEAPIAALRRGYALARESGWPEIAAIRIAAKTVLDICDAGDKPSHLKVIK
jgi:hypothetical protein